jgi:hypothetical protein
MPALNSGETRATPPASQKPRHPLLEIPIQRPRGFCLPPVPFEDADPGVAGENLQARGAATS